MFKITFDGYQVPRDVHADAWFQEEDFVVFTKDGESVAWFKAMSVLSIEVAN